MDLSQCPLARSVALGWRAPYVVNLYSSANVRRQVSLAGGEGGSQSSGVKALGMLFCKHPLCLNAKSRNPPLESRNGQRLAERPCSPFSFRGPPSCGIASALVWLPGIVILSNLQSLENGPLMCLLWQNRSPRIDHAHYSQALRLRAAVARCLYLPGSHAMLCGVNRRSRIACAICRKPIFLCERPR